MELIEEVAERTWQAVERVRAEQALRASEARLAASFTGAGVGMAVLDERAQLAHVNPTFCRILGRSGDQLIGHSCLTFTHPDDREHNERVIAEVANGQIESGLCDKRYLRLDGAVVWPILTSSRWRS